MFSLTNEPVASLERALSKCDKTIRVIESHVSVEEPRTIVVGVLSIQGDFQKHLNMLGRLPNVAARRVRFTDELDELDGLIIPGGESTTFTIHFDRWGYRKAIEDFIASGRWVWGTCAGAIMLSSCVFDNDEQVDVKALKAVDCDVIRNGFGRQVESFEAPIEIQLENGCSQRFIGIFIRAPRFTNVGKSARVIGVYGSEPVMVEQSNILISSFHPELTDDSFVHEFFVGKVRASLEKRL